MVLSRPLGLSRQGGSPFTARGTSHDFLPKEFSSRTFSQIKSKKSSMGIALPIFQLKINKILTFSFILIPMQV